MAKIKTGEKIYRKLKKQGLSDKERKSEVRQRVVGGLEKGTRKNYKKGF
jgi:ribosomal protein S20